MAASVPEGERQADPRDASVHQPKNRQQKVVPPRRGLLRSHGKGDARHCRQAVALEGTLLCGHDRPRHVVTLV